MIDNSLIPLGIGKGYITALANNTGIEKLNKSKINFDIIKKGTCKELYDGSIDAHYCHIDVMDNANAFKLVIMNVCSTTDIILARKKVLEKQK